MENSGHTYATKSPESITTLLGDFTKGEQEQLHSLQVPFTITKTAQGAIKVQLDGSDCYHGPLKPFLKKALAIFNKKPQTALDLNGSLKKMRKFSSRRPSNPQEGLTELLHSALKEDILSGSQVAQIIFHKKGSKTASSLSVTPSGKHSKGTLAAKDFSSLFQSIKKSKNKSFSQIVAPKKHLSVMGPFLAKEFDSHHYSLIFLFSRNGFLPFTDKEIQYFDQISILLKIHALRVIHDSESKKLAILKSLVITTLNEEQLALSRVNAEYFHQERVSLLGELLNTLRHELSNPIFGLKLSSELSLIDQENLEIKEAMRQIYDCSCKSEQILQNFSSLYSNGDQCELFSLKGLIENIFTVSKSISRGIKRNFEFRKDHRIVEDIVMWGKKVELGQIFLNLIINSCEAITASDIKGEITIICDQINDSIEIQIIDNGPGAPKQVKDKLFNPFYTTKTDGTGLGLAICRELIARIGGEIDLPDRENGFAVKLKLIEGEKIQ